MKPVRLFGVLALALGASSQGLAAQGTPAPAQQDAAAAYGGPPANWWQLDPGTDRVYGIASERAYRELLANRQPRRTVVVAIIDSGIEVDHPDLKDVIWTNPREVAGNGRDDDGNGYVDDIHGWDFLGGRDGRDLHHETYEVTRLYAALRKYEGANPDTLNAAGKAEYQRFQTIRRQFQEDRAEAEGMVQQIRQISAGVQRITAILAEALGTREVTAEKVAALQTSRPEVQQAKALFLQLAASDITPERVEEERESLEGRLQYGLNPDYNPRGIVGDDPANGREKGYGNGEVEGPDATHGTHVAGIVGAVRNNVGMNGVATGVRIMVLRAVPDGDERDKDVANAIRYAVDNGAQVINMSFGKSHSPQKELVDEAVRYADEKGVLLVHASGNEGADLETSENYPTRTYLGGGEPRNWIEVGASSWNGADSLAASFSNYGQKKVDVFAPGVSIYSTVTDGGYERNDGTSMASPVVAGTAALIMAYYPTLTATQVKEIILQSATRLATQNVVRPGGEGSVPFGQLSSSGGIVNVYEALRLAEQRAGGGR